MIALVMVILPIPSHGLDDMEVAERKCLVCTGVAETLLPRKAENVEAGNRILSQSLSAFRSRIEDPSHWELVSVEDYHEVLMSLPNRRRKNIGIAVVGSTRWRGDYESVRLGLSDAEIEGKEYYGAFFVIDRGSVSLGATLYLGSWWPVSMSPGTESAYAWPLASGDKHSLVVLFHGEEGCGAGACYFMHFVHYYPTERKISLDSYSYGSGGTMGSDVATSQFDLSPLVRGTGDAFKIGTYGRQAHTDAESCHTTDCIWDHGKRVYECHDRVLNCP